jgi:hypothetical protein
MEVSCSRRDCYLDKSISNFYSFPSVGEKKILAGGFFVLAGSFFQTSQLPSKLQCVLHDGGNRL